MSFPKADRDKAVLERIGKALIASGHTSLDAQTRALGLPRSTVWTIVTNQHKLGRLSRKVTERMLANPNLPPLVRRELESALNQPNVAISAGSQLLPQPVALRGGR